MNTTFLITKLKFSLLPPAFIQCVTKLVHCSEIIPNNELANNTSHHNTKSPTIYCKKNKKFQPKKKSHRITHINWEIMEEKLLTTFNGSAPLSKCVEKEVHSTEKLFLLQLAGRRLKFTIFPFFHDARPR